MTCANCGGAVTAGAPFCPQCGARVAAAPPPDAPAAVTGPAPRAKRSRASDFLWGCLAAGVVNVVLFAAVAGGLVVIFRLFGHACLGEALGRPLLIAVAVAIVGVILWRLERQKRPEGAFWLGFALTAFVPFLPCTFAFGTQLGGGCVTGSL